MRKVGYTKEHAVGSNFYEILEVKSFYDDRNHYSSWLELAEIDLKEA